MTIKRFYYAEKFSELEPIALHLETLGFKELDPCIDEFSHNSQKLYIDTKKKQFWYIDEAVLDQNKQLIDAVYNLNHRAINLKQIQQWQLA
tara:strand:+ start:7329 stop:7601 length:273 start_codon:yes stop_codon:yes gene_type:complete